MMYLYKITIIPGIAYEAAGDQSLELLPGQRIVVKCDQYSDIGTIAGVAPALPFDNLEEFESKRARQCQGRHIEGRRLPRILRIATADDLKTEHDNIERANAIHVRAQDCIHRRNLEMKLIQTRYSLDRRVIFFQFSAEGRVDFRELLRDLSGSFRARVELRQIGVRDEASILGGLGPCGRRLCCCSFLSAISSVNVKTAKLQGLSLNPHNISGCCGRLRCCLQFEADNYRNSKNRRPPKNPPPTA